MGEYFRLEDEAKERSLKLPKVFMMEVSKYFNMSAMAKLMYSILSDRNSLSIKNKWVDDQKRVYFLFKQTEIGKMIGIKDTKTVRKYLNELEKNELLERKRQGLNEPDRLYLKHPEVEENQLYHLMGENSLSEEEKFPISEGNIPCQDEGDSPTNKNEYNKTECNKNKYNNIYDLDALEIWSLYPKKKGKSDAMKKIPKILKKISKEELIRCIDRYKSEFKNNNYTYMVYGGRFFNGVYEDYLDENYTEKEEMNNAFDF